MASLISALSRSALARRVVRILHLHKLGNAWLQRFPKVGQLPGSGVTWRATRLESISLAHEMFDKGNLYDAALLPEGYVTFADLGCNVGYFTCWLTHLAKCRKLKGLMLDANPDAVREARWHAHVNGLTEVVGVHGILGENNPTGAKDFFLYESNICSTSQLTDIKNMGLKGKWMRISVPCVSLADEWDRHFCGRRCNVLKVDIEGSELNFLMAERAFLDRVDTIFIEWHKWRVTFDDLKSLLESCGFCLDKIIEEGDAMGSAFFSRKPNFQLKGVEAKAEANSPFLT